MEEIFNRIGEFLVWLESSLVELEIIYFLFN